MRATQSQIILSAPPAPHGDPHFLPMYLNRQESA